MALLKASEVRDVAGSVLAWAGVPTDHAAIQLDILLEAELRGVPSYGLLRLDLIIQRIANLGPALDHDLSPASRTASRLSRFMTGIHLATSASSSAR
jgi:LDH2 family malate/lactate/ureidoglycolate dehydrogenase